MITLLLSGVGDGAACCSLILEADCDWENSFRIRLSIANLKIEYKFSVSSFVIEEMKGACKELNNCKDGKIVITDEDQSLELIFIQQSGDLFFTLEVESIHPFDRKQSETSAQKGSHVSVGPVCINGQLNRLMVFFEGYCEC